MEPKLLRELVSKPTEFNFHEAVRLVEKLSLGVGKRPLGYEASDQPEAVEFSLAPILRFPPGAIIETEPGPPLKIRVAFFGLVGPQGALPQHYTALIMARRRLKDHTLRDFLDLFHQRILTYYHRAWEKNRIPFAHERAELDPVKSEAVATRAMYSLAGLGATTLRNRQAYPDQAVVSFAGLFARRQPTAQAMEQILSDYFRKPVKLEPFSPQWLRLDDDNRCNLPRLGMEKGSNAQLGRDAIIGGRVRDVQGKIRLTVGPVDAKSFRSFLPDGDALREFGQLARLYLGMEFDLDVRVMPEAEATPWPKLVHDERERPRLGWNVWLRSHNFAQPPREAIFDLG
jgi:type VI secretion system protein ImpH